MGIAAIALAESDAAMLSPRVQTRIIQRQGVVSNYPLYCA